jgi:hypothetical protein
MVIFAIALISANAEPLDTKAADILMLVKERITFREKMKPLTKGELSTVLQQVETDNTDVRMAVAYVLGFSDSEEATKNLQALVADKDSNVSGTAIFVEIWKKALQINEKQRLAMLSFELGRCQQEWTKLLLIGRLGDEYGASVMPLFLTALETEKSGQVRAELFYQIACYGSVAQLEYIRKLLVEEKAETPTMFSESSAYFLNTISNNPIRREYQIPPKFFMQSQIKSRINRLSKEEKSK